jgi:hypothetical protein
MQKKAFLESMSQERLCGRVSVKIAQFASHVEFEGAEKESYATWISLNAGAIVKYPLNVGQKSE